MPTRFYTPRWDGRAAAVSTAPGSQWQQTTNSFSGATARLAATTKGATAPTSTTSTNFTKSSTSQPWNTLQMQCVSDTLNIAQTITGTFSAVFRIGETTTAADVSLQVVIRVVSQNGATERGVLYAGHTAANNATAGALGQEAPTAAATRVIPAGTALSPVAAQAGDRVVIEIGTRSTATNNTTSGFLTLGDNSATADHALGAGNATALVPWVELSQTLTFGTPAATETLPSPATLVDDFSSGSLTAYDDWAAAQSAIVAGELHITTTTAAGYYGVSRLATVDINEAYVGARVVSAGNQSLASYGAYPIDLTFSANNEAYWLITSNQAQCWTNVGGTYTQRGTSLAYVAGAHVWFAIGEVGGQLRWVWSTNGTDWTVHTSVANPFGADTIVNPYFMVGTDAAEASTTTFQVDDLTTWGIGVSGSTLAVAGAATTVPAAAGALRLIGALSGAASTTPTASADLRVFGAVSGGALTTPSAAATIMAGLPVAGGATTIPAAAASLLAVLAVSGSAATVPAAAAALAARFPLAGAATTTPTAAAALGLRIPVTGQAATVPAAAGAIGVRFPISGAATTTPSATGALRLTIQISGDASTTPAAAAELSRALPISGGAVTVPSAAGQIVIASGPQTYDVAGGATTTPAAAGSLALRSAVTGGAVTVPAAAGSLVFRLGVSGSASTNPAASGSLTARLALAGSATTTPVAAGQLGLRFVITGAAVTTPSTAATLGLRRLLSGAAVTIGSAAAELELLGPAAAITLRPASGTTPRLILTTTPGPISGVTPRLSPEVTARPSAGVT